MMFFWWGGEITERQKIMPGQKHENNDFDHGFRGVKSPIQESGLLKL